MGTRLSEAPQPPNGGSTIRVLLTRQARERKGFRRQIDRLCEPRQDPSRMRSRIFGVAYCVRFRRWVGDIKILRFNLPHDGSAEPQNPAFGTFSILFLKKFSAPRPLCVRVGIGRIPKAELPGSEEPCGIGADESQIFESLPIITPNTLTSRVGSRHATAAHRRYITQ